MTPEGAAKLVKLGAEVTVQAGLGLAAGFADDAYTRAGATIATDRQALVSAGEVFWTSTSASACNVSFTVAAPVAP